jgi:hypothetical protein
MRLPGQVYSTPIMVMFSKGCGKRISSSGLNIDDFMIKILKIDQLESS